MEQQLANCWKNRHRRGPTDGNSQRVLVADVGAAASLASAWPSWSGCRSGSRPRRRGWSIPCSHCRGGRRCRCRCRSPAIWRRPGRANNRASPVTCTRTRITALARSPCAMMAMVSVLPSSMVSAGVDRETLGSGSSLRI